jgi:predicted nucleic acid-binding protein
VTVLIDTSALYALVDRRDANHVAAVALWNRLLGEDVRLCTSSYVLVEILALAQRRLGLPAVQALADELLPVVTVAFVSPEDHAAALAGLLAANRRDLSFVDCASFQIMRRQEIRTAFAFDPHFAEQGFAVRP